MTVQVSFLQKQILILIVKMIVFTLQWSTAESLWLCFLLHYLQWANVLIHLKMFTRKAFVRFYIKFPAGKLDFLKALFKNKWRQFNLNVLKIVALDTLKSPLLFSQYKKIKTTIWKLFSYLKNHKTWNVVVLQIILNCFKVQVSKVS